jgi:nitrogen-specific signal transduction histidine kinase
MAIRPLKPCRGEPEESGRPARTAIAVAGGPEWELSLEEAMAGHWSHRTQELVLTPSGRDPVPVSRAITPVDQAPARLLTEFRIIDQQIKIAREERLNEQAEANRQLMRNLAHEIKNPLGGIRGAAQLLEHELPLHPSARIHPGHHQGVVFACSP